MTHLVNRSAGINTSAGVGIAGGAWVEEEGPAFPRSQLSPIRLRSPRAASPINALKQGFC